MCVDTKAEIQQELLCSLKGLSLGVEQNGIDFFEYLFTNHPHLRIHFLGAERFNSQRVQESERFAKLGQTILLRMHFLAISYDQPQIIKALAREMVLKHRQLKMDPYIWHSFFDIWCSFLASKGLTQQNSRNAWGAIGKLFGDEYIRYTWEIGP